MMEGMTIGQYFPGNSLLHRLDARFKIVIVLLHIVMLFTASNIWSLAVGVVFIVAAYALSGIPGRTILRGLKPLLPLLIFTSLLNMLFVSGEPLVEWGFFRISNEGLKLSGFMIVRIVALLVGTSLLTYTTSAILLTDAIERLLSPLAKLKAPVHEMAMMMTIALRFIPTLLEETTKIMAAQKARGADLDSGGVMKRAKALIPVLVPLFVSAFRRAEDLALAMECRCYHGGEGRTRLRQLKAAKRDYLAIFLTVAAVVLVVVVNHL